MSSFFQGFLCRCRLLLTCLTLAGHAFWSLRERMPRLSCLIYGLFSFSSNRQRCDITFASVRLISTRLFLEEAPLLWSGEPLRHQCTYWPLSCPEPSITLYKDQLGRSVESALPGLRCHIELFSVWWCYTQLFNQRLPFKTFDFIKGVLSTN